MVSIPSIRFLDGCKWMNLFLLQKNSPRKRSGNYEGGVGADGSDESETSSICSEKSYPEYGRRSSDVSF